MQQVPQPRGVRTRAEGWWSQSDSIRRRLACRHSGSRTLGSSPWMGSPKARPRAAVSMSIIAGGSRVRLQPGVASPKETCCGPACWARACRGDVLVRRLHVQPRCRHRQLRHGQLDRLCELDCRQTGS